MKRIPIIFLLTVLGALLVSYLSKQQLALVSVLLSLLASHLILVWMRHRNWTLLLQEVFFLVTCGVIGYLTESWGTTHGHWTYHHMPEGQNVPYWVPLAWSIASVLLSMSEKYVEAELTLRGLHSSAARLTCAYTLGMILPWVGESICIALGIWTYHWPYKILGVPLLALLLISYAHLVFSLIRAGAESWTAIAPARTTNTATIGKKSNRQHADA